MTRFSSNVVLALLAIGTFCISCTKEKSADKATVSDGKSVQDSTDIIYSIEGFLGPEAVRYDAEQDVYFVSNFNGGGGDRDANGFISKVSTHGTIDDLRFMVGTEDHPLHAPRGMYITGETLWAADVDGVHGFNRKTGEQVSFIDFTEFDPGFLNDIAEGNDGHLYITDTGKSVVYRIASGTPSMAADSLPHPPNGITLDPESKKLILAPWGGGTTFYHLEKDDNGYMAFDEAEGGGNYDGIEFVNGYLVSASQMDSSLHVLKDGTDKISIHVPGRPADIGVDTKRMHVAVPYIALNRVDIWQLPGNN